MNTPITIAAIALAVAAAALLTTGLAIMPNTPAKTERSWLLLSAGMGAISCLGIVLLLPLMR